ncbi:MAG: type III-A CRISPR-associated RAMP protein Csm3 [Desulfobacterota bacterium]|nr:type III-A CRISPR-associated RAMP protein Csm3 [Thermodesulfobacteriota bacterium]
MTQNTLKLDKKFFIRGYIIAKTGLHIGGSSLGLTIGGADKVVVRDPLTNLPYIPGSSLKGKMRSLLEKSHGKVKITKNKKGEYEGSLCSDPKEPIVQLFGFPAEAEKMKSENIAPTRLTVRDAHLLNKEELEQAQNTDMYCTEIKTEVSIDRLTSAANPRNFERVPAGAKFGFELVLDIYNIDNEVKTNGSTRADYFIDLIKQGLELIEEDYLGGQGTRGYGQVRFVIEEILVRTADDYRNGKQAGKAEEEKKKFSRFSNK